MSLPLDSLFKYSTVGVIACCSGVGTCFSINHEHDEQQDLQYVELTNEIRGEIEEEIKESIRSQTSECVGKESERVQENRVYNSSRWTWTWKDEVPKYDGCVEQIELGGVLQDLYAKEKDKLLSVAEA